MLAIYLTLIDNEDDKKSFEDLYNQNRSKAYAIAFNILKNKALAEEACSEAFIYRSGNPLPEDHSWHGLQ